MRPEDTFKLKIIQEPNCYNTSAEPRYGILFDNHRGFMEYVDFSYTELYKKLIDSLKDYKPLSDYYDLEKEFEFNRSFSNLTLIDDNCVSYVAFCDFLSPCILSTYTDPL